MRLLITGFGPFPGVDENHSGSLARDCAQSLATNGADATHAELPVSYRRCPGALRTVLDKTGPDAVLMLGVKLSSPWLSLERVALNAFHASIPDADGALVEHAPVLQDGREAIFAGGDVPGLAAHLGEHGHDGRPSYHAGTYVCNQAYYLASQALEASLGGPNALFVHVPRLPEQTPADRQATALPYDRIAAAVTCIGAFIAGGRLFNGDQAS
jgi:pyroglutamyl-peptidase